MSNKVEIVATVSKLESIGYKEPEGVRVTATPEDSPAGAWVTLPLGLGILPPKLGDTIRIKATWGPLGEPFPEVEVGTLAGEVIGRDGEPKWMPGDPDDGPVVTPDGMDV